MGELLSYDPALVAALSASQEHVVTPLSVISSALDHLIERTAQGDQILFQNQARAFVMASADQGVSSMPIQTLGQPPAGPLLAGSSAQVCIKTGYIADDDVFVSKIAAGGGAYYASESDKQQGKLTATGNTGMVLVFSQRTMRLNKLLLDEGILTEVRTAAACVLASKLLFPLPITSPSSSSTETSSNDDISCIGLLGAGVQAIWHLRFLRCITSCRKVLVKTRSEDSARGFVDRMRTSACAMDREWEIAPAPPLAAFASCELIHAVSAARPGPALTSADLPPSGSPLHVTAAGADAPGKRELETTLLETFDLVTMDSETQSVARGELQHVTHPRDLQRDHVTVSELGALLRAAAEHCETVSPGAETVSLRGVDAELGAVVGSRGSVRRHVGVQRGRTVVRSVFDSSGMAVQDIQIAKLVMQVIEEMRPPA